MLEAKALQQDLHAQGVSAFLCDIPEGQDLAGAVLTALTHCKLAVILGTRTYGKDTGCGFSTYEELRYIVEVKKPIFLIKMCQAFEEQYAVFRLPSSISHFPWQPATDAERKQLPPGLVEKIVRRLGDEDVTWRHPGYEAPPLAVLHTQPPALLEEDGNLPASINTDLGQWLHSLQLDEFEPALRKLGAIDAHDVKTGFAEGDVTKAMLEEQGFRPLRISRLQREANKVRVICPACDHFLPMPYCHVLLISFPALLYDYAVSLYDSCKSAATHALDPQTNRKY